jgi:hypothetical protein
MIKNHASGPAYFCQALVCICEVFLNRKHGYIWPFDNLDASADKLYAILENESLYIKLSNQARTQFEAHFSEHALSDVSLTAIIDS